MRHRARLRLLVQLALVGFASGPAAAPAQEPAFQTARGLHRAALDNGLQVLVVENHAVPIATVLLAVRNGAFIQQPGEEGLAHVYEHLVFRGYDGDPTAFGSAVAKMTGSSNATTSEDVVTYYVMVPSEHTSDAIRLLARLIPRSRFKASDLTAELPVIVDEIRRGESDPEQMLVHRVDRRLWGDAWHRKDVGGDSLSLRRITLHRLQAVFTRYYVPNNAALIVTGDVSPSAVVAAARDRLSEWKRGPDPFADQALPPIKPLVSSSAVLVRDNVQDVTISIRFHGPSLREDTASTYAADALLELLNDPSSWFQQQMVATGLFQSLSVGYLTVNDVGAISFHGKTPQARSQEALTMLLDAMEKFDLLLEEIREDDLTIAKKRRQVRGALGREQAATLAHSLAFWWAAAGIDYYLGYPERLSAQTLDDLQRFARRYVVGRPRVIGVLGPPAFIDWFAQWMRGERNGHR